MSLPSPTPRGSARGHVVLALVAAFLVVIIVVAGAFAISAARHVRSVDRQNSDRAEALLSAEQFALRMDDFAAPDAGQYQSKIEEMLTTKGKADFAQVKSVIGQVYTLTQPTKAAAAKGAVAPTGKIIYAGISDIDADSATILLAHDTSVSGSTKALHFRWTVAVKKIGSTWLVDGLPPEIAGSASQ